MKFGLIGAGCIGQIRARALRQVAGARLIAVSDPDSDRAKALASPLTRVIQEPKSLAAHAELDAVIVSTPPQFHEELVTAALRAGKHVLCEKPLANSPDGCRRLVELARQTGRTLAVGFNHRYFPAIQFVKRALDSGAIGELDHLRAFAGHPGLSQFRSPWEYDRNVIGGGALMDVGIHLIDLTSHLLGGVEEVVGMTTNTVWRLPGTEDNGLALFRGANGKVASLQATWTEWKGYRFHIDAYGDKGMVRAYYAPMMNYLIRLDKPGGRRQRQVKFYPWIMVREKFRGWQSTVEDTFRQEFQDFLALCVGKPGTIAEGFDGFRAVEIANALYRSTSERKSIRLTTPF